MKSSKILENEKSKICLFLFKYTICTVLLGVNWKLQSEIGIIGVDFLLVLIELVIILSAWAYLSPLFLSVWNIVDVEHSKSSY